MTPTTKKILLIGTGIVVGSAILAYNKVQKIKGIFDLMDIEPTRISNISDFDWDSFKFNLDVKLTNKSPDDLFVSGASVATLKRIVIYYNDTYLATADVNISEIAIEGNDALTVKNIPVELDYATALKNIKALVNNFSVEKMGVIGVVEALGVEYKIGEE